MTTTYLQEAARMVRNVNVLTDGRKAEEMLIGVYDRLSHMDYGLSREARNKLPAECAEFLALYGVLIETYLDATFYNRHQPGCQTVYRDVGKRFHGSRNGSTSVNHSFIQVAPKLHRAAQMFGRNAPPGRLG